MRAGEGIGLAFPFVKLPERDWIAVEVRKAPAVFEDRLGHDIGVLPARFGKFRVVHACKFVEQ